MMKHTPPLAYHNGVFLDSDEGRPLRILAEYLQPLKALGEAQVQNTIVFFGSVRLAPLGVYYDEARELSRLVTQWSMSLLCDACRFVVCSGGGGGIMEAANRDAQEAFQIIKEALASEVTSDASGFACTVIPSRRALVDPPSKTTGRVPEEVQS